ncbi:hypothetical protein GCM10023331_08620 [Algivirga pacifica]|uniref:Outer membrane protein beta-barrel domain-containing protein n=2 Tax=Algivirga pacifica TaxID=1162670 RepID=A0ABP9D9S9_9BACT
MLATIPLWAQQWSDLHIPKEKHESHHFELEVSYNSAMHFEFTGSVYFAPEMKVQMSVEDTGKHFAGCLVRELPFRNSPFGTFVGFGGTVGMEDGTEGHDGEVHTSIIAQSGLAYTLSEHWSTGVTVSPGVDIHTKHLNMGATLDLVYAF